MINLSGIAGSNTRVDAAGNNDRPATAVAENINIVQNSSGGMASFFDLTSFVSQLEERVLNINPRPLLEVGEFFDTLIYNENRGSKILIRPFDHQVPPAGELVKFTQAVQAKINEARTRQDGEYCMATGRFFILPAQQRYSRRTPDNPQFSACLQQGLLSMVIKKDFNYDARNCLPDFVVMTTLAMSSITRGEHVVERAHVFYLDAFRPKNVKEFLNVFVDVMHQTWQKGDEFEKMAIVFALANLDDAWHLSNAAPDFAEKMSHEEFLAIRNEVLGKAEFADLKSAMAVVSASNYETDRPSP